MATGKAPASARKPRTRSAPIAASATQETRYIESSALLAALLEGDPAAVKAIRAPGRRVTSALTLAEVYRAVIRARTTGRLSTAIERDAIRGLQTFARRCEIIAVSDEVLIRAGRPFPVEPMPTLGAVHLATAELLGEPPPLVTFITRNKRVADNARALGYTLA